MEAVSAGERLLAQRTRRVYGVGLSTGALLLLALAARRPLSERELLSRGGAYAAAEILGVSPQRVRELAVTNPAFPEPMYELRTGKLWLRDALDIFARRDRKPGRPPKTQTAL